jgi:hypothetical protein
MLRGLSRHSRMCWIIGVGVNRGRMLRTPKRRAPRRIKGRFVKPNRIWCWVRGRRRGAVSHPVMGAGAQFAIAVDGT